MKNMNNGKKTNLKSKDNSKIEFLRKIKKTVKKEKISYEFRVENYNNPDKRLYTYGIR